MHNITRESLQEMADAVGATLEFKSSYVFITYRGTLRKAAGFRQAYQKLYSYNRRKNKAKIDN